MRSRLAEGGALAMRLSLCLFLEPRVQAQRLDEALIASSNGGVDSRKRRAGPQEIPDMERTSAIQRNRLHLPEFAWKAKFGDRFSNPVEPHCARPADWLTKGRR